jgi:hypothetical protein
MNTIPTRGELIERARRLGFPRCQYASVTLEGQAQWTEAAMPYAIDRLELAEQLDRAEASR